MLFPALKTRFDLRTKCDGENHHYRGLLEHNERKRGIGPTEPDSTGYRDLLEKAEKTARFDEMQSEQSAAAFESRIFKV